VNTSVKSIECCWKIWW